VRTRVRSRLHAQIESVQVATLPAGNYLAMRALVFSLAIVIPTSGRNGENKSNEDGLFITNDFSGAAIWSGLEKPTVSATN